MANVVALRGCVFTTRTEVSEIAYAPTSHIPGATMCPRGC